MKTVPLLLAFLSSLTLTGFQSTGKITKESFTVNGEKRIYYLFVPKDLSQSSPAPLLITLHGSNRNGSSLVETWQDLARKEGFIIAGPDSKDPSTWSALTDGPDFLYALAEAVKSKYPVDPKRVYIFGHSGGATFALWTALEESEYFAAAAAHAGAFRVPGEYAVISVAERKIPLAIFVGVNDPLFPLASVRQTRDALKEAGFPVELTEIPNHDHNYYAIASKINSAAWEYLKTKQLSADPRYQERKFRR